MLGVCSPGSTLAKMAAITSETHHSRQESRKKFMRHPITRPGMQVLELDTNIADPDKKSLADHLYEISRSDSTSRDATDVVIPTATQEIVLPLTLPVITTTELVTILVSAWGNIWPKFEITKPRIWGTRHLPISRQRWRYPQHSWQHPNWNFHLHNLHNRHSLKMKVNTRLKIIYKNCHSLSISNPITTASPDMEGHTTL